MADYNHTFEVLKTLPTPLVGYSNPTSCEIAEGETGNAEITLQNSSMLSNRLYAVEFKDLSQDAQVELAVHDTKVLSVFVGNNVSALNLSNSTNLENIEFADPDNIKVIRQNCFCSNGRLSIDIKLLSNVTQLEDGSFTNCRFNDDVLVIPASLATKKDNRTNFPFKNVLSVREIVWELNNEAETLSARTILYNDVPYEILNLLSSFKFSDNAMRVILTPNGSDWTFIYSALDRNWMARLEHDETNVTLDTLSTLHNLTNPNNFGTNHYNSHIDLIKFNAVSGNVYTFSKFDRNELEDQSSHAFDEYLGLLPHKSFVPAFIDCLFANHSTVSVWVPTSLYATWKNDWAEYQDILHPYGPWEDPTETTDITFDGNRSYIISTKDSTGLTLENQTGPITVALSAYDVGDEIPSNND